MRDICLSTKKSRQCRKPYFGSRSQRLQSVRGGGHRMDLSLCEQEAERGRPQLGFVLLLPFCPPPPPPSPWTMGLSHPSWSLCKHLTHLGSSLCPQTPSRNAAGSECQGAARSPCGTSRSGANTGRVFAEVSPRSCGEIKICEYQTASPAGAPSGPAKRSRSQS